MGSKHRIMAEILKLVTMSNKREIMVSFTHLFITITLPFITYEELRSGILNIGGLGY